MDGWSVIDLKNMSTMEMKQLMSQLQNEIQFREEIGESFNKQDPQLLVEDDSVHGI